MPVVVSVSYRDRACGVPAAASANLRNGPCYNGHMPKLKMRPFLPRPDDPDILERIRDAITKGHPLRTAATLAGLHEDTAYGWKSRGKADLDAWDGGSELSSHAALRTVTS